jgi:hypothetical protein
MKRRIAWAIIAVAGTGLGVLLLVTAPIVIPIVIGLVALGWAIAEVMP